MNKLCSEGPQSPAPQRPIPSIKIWLFIWLLTFSVPSSYIIGSTCSLKLTKLSCIAVSVTQVLQAKQH